MIKRTHSTANAKIICTIGPSSQSINVLIDMIHAGMDVARLNFSHGEHKLHLLSLKNIREASKRTQSSTAILLDLGGPKIRTGVVEQGAVELKKGAHFTFTTDTILGTSERVSTTYKQLPKDVKIGDTILLDDGNLRLTVVSKNEKEVSCTVIYGGVLKDKKGMNLPNVNISVPSMTEKDIADLEFGLAHDIDYVALSFVRSADDLRTLRKQMARIAPKKNVPIVAKIEKPEALDHIDSIIAETDVIMVARGDLGVELTTEDVPVAQKMIVRKCNERGVPVIIATQMLESMIHNARPTRAEASDVANAVLDGADAVMLSAETSVGEYPVIAVQTMDNIIRKVEGCHQDHLNIVLPPTDPKQRVFDAIERSACVLSKEVNATAIVTLTRTGATAIGMSKFRPEAPIIAITDEEETLRRLNLIWGVRGVIVKNFEKDKDLTFKRIKNALIEDGCVRKGDIIVLSAGIPFIKKGTTNTVRLEIIE
jgi:pyruvate kinase